MNPEVEDQMQESQEEKMAIQMDQEEAKRDLADVKKASGQSRESQMEAAVKKLLGPTVQGMTLAEIMKLSDEDIAKLAKAFAWLIKEDRKQNPKLYEKKRAS
jgi:cytochrome c553